MRAFILTLVLFSAMWLGVSAQQSHALVWVKVLDENSDLVTLDNDPRVAINLARAAEIKNDEAKLHELQIENAKLNDQVLQLNANLQDEKVKFAKKQQEYEGQVSVVADLAKALNHGGGPKGLSDWRVDLGLKIAPTVTNFLRRCS